ncbi:MAG TPA: MFS transporter [Anaerolineae bacterium]|nr:MFS transporter [Anaerolineae bacterium]HOQ97374.1 MFS transporter [Anaerolineae bacterium]HPL27349.1 MFS transporter [Anaerolineae bacterium]
MHLATGHDDLPQGHFNPALALYPLAHLAVELYSSMLSIMWPLFAVRFGLTYGAIGALNMVFRGSMTLPQIGFAPVADRYGPRLLAIAGLLVMAVGMSLVGLAPSVAVLAAILAVAPLGSAAFHPAGTSHMSRVLARRRGTAVALFMVGGTVGSSLGPVVGAWLYTRHGVAASLWLLPVGLAVALPMLLFIPAAVRGATQRTAAARPASRVPGAIVLLMAACVFQAWLENSLVSYLPLLYTERDLPLAAASQVLFIFSAMGAGGVMVGGMLSDRLPRWRIVVFAQVLSVPLFVGTLLLGGPWALLAPAGLGFVSALSHPVTVAIGQELMPDRVSLASALTMGMSWVIGSLGVTLTGFLADRLGMQPALLMVAVVPLVGMACMLILRWRTPRPAPAAQA